MARILDELRAAPERLANQGSDLRKRARRRARTLRLTSESRLFTARLDAFTRVEELLHAAPEWPGLGKVADAAERMVAERREAFAHPPIGEYDTLNVRAITDALRDLDYVGLLRVRRWEETRKARLTVLRAVEKELERREDPPEL